MNIYEGDFIIVKPNVRDPDLGICIAGWQGTVTEISLDKKLVCIEWDGQTLKDIPDSAITKYEEKGIPWSEMYLEATEVELTTYRKETEEDLALIKCQIESKHAWDFLGEEGRCIKQILAHVDPNDERAIFEAWKAHLQNVLRFPFAAKVFGYQRGSKLREGDKILVQGIAAIDDFSGVLVRIENERESFAHPLCDLVATDTESSNYNYVRIYSVWFDNCRVFYKP